MEILTFFAYYVFGTVLLGFLMVKANHGLSISDLILLLAGGVIWPLLLVVIALSFLVFFLFLDDGPITEKRWFRGW